MTDYAHNPPSQTGNRQSHAPAVARMRAYRKRRRGGLQYVRVVLHVTDIDALIRQGSLKEEQRQDPEAIQAAVMDLIYRTLGT